MPWAVLPDPYGGTEAVEKAEGASLGDVGLTDEPDTVRRAGRLPPLDTGPDCHVRSACSKVQVSDAMAGSLISSSAKSNSFLG